MIVGRFDKEDVARGGEFMVDAHVESTRARAGVFRLIDRGDDIIEVGFMSEFEGRKLRRALEEASSALRYRADRLMGLAGEDAEAVSLVRRWRGDAALLDDHRKEIPE